MDQTEKPSDISNRSTPITAWFSLAPCWGTRWVAPCDFVTREDRLLYHSIREVAEYWQLLDPELPNALTILEVSPAGIVVADALQTKALVPTERFHVEWPDVARRLVLWNDPTS